MARTMNSFPTPILCTWTPDLVQAAPDPTRAFAEYIQQTLGVPWPTVRDMAILRKKCNDFFDHYPNLDYRTLCRVVIYCRNRKRRPARMWMVVEEFRKAWSSGALPELEPSTQQDDGLEEKIIAAIQTEQDPVWRRRLMLAQGVAARQEVYQSWVTSSTCP